MHRTQSAKTKQNRPQLFAVYFATFCRRRHKLRRPMHALDDPKQHCRDKAQGKYTHQVMHDPPPPPTRGSINVNCGLVLRHFGACG